MCYPFWSSGIVVHYIISLFISRFPSHYMSHFLLYLNFISRSLSPGVSLFFSVFSLLTKASYPYFYPPIFIPSPSSSNRSCISSAIHYSNFPQFFFTSFFFSFLLPSHFLYTLSVSPSLIIFIFFLPNNQRYIYPWLSCITDTAITFHRKCFVKLGSCIREHTGCKSWLYLTLSRQFMFSVTSMSFFLYKWPTAEPLEYTILFWIWIVRYLISYYSSPW